MEGAAGSVSPVVVHRKYRAGMVVLFREKRWEIDAVEFWRGKEKLTLRALAADSRVKVFEVWSHDVEFTGALVLATAGEDELEALGAHVLPGLSRLIQGTSA